MANNNYNGGLGGFLGGGLGLYQQLAQQNTTQYQYDYYNTTSTTTDYATMPLSLNPGEKPKAQFYGGKKSFLSALREEIKDWHGDILDVA